jgi:hypothetical protein
MCDPEGGEFLGAFVVNRETDEECQQAAVTALCRKTGRTAAVECVSAPLAPGMPAIPPGMYGRVLSLEDIQAHASEWGPAVHIDGGPV